MRKAIKISMLVIGILLLINGIGKVIDDSRVVTYNITSILSGIGSILISRIKRA